MTDFLQDLLAGYDDELYHHGILSQKWGVRRYQNKDGSLTEAGKKRYYTSELKDSYARYSKSKPAYDKATSDYNKRVSAMMDHYDKAYTYNPKTARLDENPAELKKGQSHRRTYQKDAHEVLRQRSEHIAILHRWKRTCKPERTRKFLVG